jgi:hypothetical protein
MFVAIWLVMPPEARAMCYSKLECHRIVSIHQVLEDRLAMTEYTASSLTRFWKFAHHMLLFTNSLKNISCSTQAQKVFIQERSKLSIQGSTT